MKFSYVMLPDIPVQESIEAIKTADQLGFYACYAADETWHKDLWLIFAAAAAETTSIRLGPSVSGVVLREPALIAQAAATLDELTGGRAEVVLGSGNFGLLAQHGVDWTVTKPLSQVREATKIIETFLADGVITHDGEFHQYNGLYTFARPVQEKLPVKIGAMKGPRSFRAAGAESDGCHHALSYTRSAYEYAWKNFSQGAESAGKNPHDLDFAAWVCMAVGEDSAAAKEAARAMVAVYASSMPPEQVERNGVDPQALQPVIDAFAAGEITKGIELMDPEIAEQLSFAGTPDEVAAKIRTELKPANVNHVICALTDAALVQTLTGHVVEGVADINEQLKLINEHIMPEFA